MNLYSQLLDLGIDESFIDAIEFAGGATPAAPSVPSAPAGPSVSSSGIAKLPSTPGQPKMPKIKAPKTPAMPKIAKGPGVTLPTGVHVPQPKTATPHVAIHVHAPGQTATSPSVAKTLSPSVQPQQAASSLVANKADQKAQAKYEKAMAKYNAKIKALNPNAGKNPWADQIIKEQQQDNIIPPPDPRTIPKSFEDMTSRVSSSQIANIQKAWTANLNSENYNATSKLATQLTRAVAAALGLNQRSNINKGFDMPNGLSSAQQAQLVNSILLPNSPRVSANPMPGVGLNTFGYTPPKSLKTYTSGISSFTVSRDKWFNQQTGQVEPIPANRRSSSWKGSEGGSALPPGYKEDASGNQIA